MHTSFDSLHRPCILLSPVSLHYFVFLFFIPLPHFALTNLTASPHDAESRLPPIHNDGRNATAQHHCRFFLKNSREDSWNSSYVDSLSQHSFILAFASSCYTRVKVLDIIHTGIFQCLIDSFTPPNTLSFVSCCFFLVAIKRLVGNWIRLFIRKLN